MPMDQPSTDLRTRLGTIIQDYADGLLDSIEDAVDAVLEQPEIKGPLGLTVVAPLPTR